MAARRRASKKRAKKAKTKAPRGPKKRVAKARSKSRAKKPLTAKRSRKKPAKRPAAKPVRAARPADSKAKVGASRDRGKRYYLTTAISYPNGAPHIGHAYEAIASDAIARFQRLDGHDVFFMTGVDEHGLKMTQTAAKEGISPRDLADRNSPQFRAMCDRMNVSYDRFIRTTEPAHYKASQAIWKKMHQRRKR